MVKVAMVEVLRVSDVMTRDVLTLPAWMPAADAAKQLLERHVGGAPVLDGRRVVGVVSKTDLLDRSGERAGPGALVSDLMTPLVYGVRETDPAMLAARLMVEEHIHRVVVLGAAEAVVGIVTSMDLLEALAAGWQPRAAREARAFGADQGLEYLDLRRLAVEGG